MSKRKNNEVFNKEDLTEYTDISDDIKIPVVEDTIKFCKVIKTISNDKAIIDFDGFGLIVDCSPDKKFVDIKYSGKIGKADFKYEVL